MGAGDLVGGFGLYLHVEPLVPAAAAGVAFVLAVGVRWEFGKGVDVESALAGRAKVFDSLHGAAGLA